ncbi:unnamed protein product [Leptosia nina]|uniref:Uncharacterized protein n=1 Tax=Leptosia nina TaxID=320188 RepID=A0AAV1JU90_9NEOP
MATRGETISVELLHMDMQFGCSSNDNEGEITCQFDNALYKNNTQKLKNDVPTPLDTSSVSWKVEPTFQRHWRLNIRHDIMEISSEVPQQKRTIRNS